MSISVEIPKSSQLMLDIPNLCNKLDFIFGCRDENDQFIPDQMGMELIVTKIPCGRGVNLRLGLFNTTVYLPTPCATSDLEVFTTLVREIAKRQKVKEVCCHGYSVKIRNLSRIVELAKNDMAEAIKYYSKLDPLENFFYVMTPFARIVIDGHEQSLFKDGQEKFDAYLAQKQSVKGINNQLVPKTLIAKSGIESIIFVDAGRYAIVPKVITRIGTNQIIKDAIAVNGEYEMDYATFIDKVPNFKEQFDAEHFIIKFSKKDFLAFAKKLDEVQPKTDVAHRHKTKVISELAEFGLSSKDIKLLDAYFGAMANLYGVISLQDAFSIIQEQTSEHFTAKQFIEFARCKNNEYLSYTIATLNPLKSVIDFDNDIVSNKLLFYNDSPYKYVKRGQQRKEYYIPPQSELLKYADEDYCEDPKLLAPLTTFLDKHALIYGGFFSAQSTVQDCVAVIKRSAMMIPVEPLLRSITDIKGCDEDGFLRKLVELIQELHNNTRLWVNRGYTPAELRKRNGIKVSNIRFF